MVPCGSREGLGAPGPLPAPVPSLRSDPCAFALVIKVLTCSWSAWKLMFMNTLWPLLDDSPRAESWAAYFIFSNVFRKLCPSLKYFFFLLFIFITAQYFYPAYPLHPPPTINNPDRCRDSTALLVWCFQTGISTIFKAQDTCASERALLLRALRRQRTAGNTASSYVFLG